MPTKKAPEDLLRGTLDMLILRTLALGPLHGYGIAKHIQRTSDDVLQVETGSLYPALRRLEQKGWIVSRWEKNEQLNRDLRLYRLTAVGRKQLVSEESTWSRLVKAIAGVMKAEEV